MTKKELKEMNTGDLIVALVDVCERAVIEVNFKSGGLTKRTETTIAMIQNEMKMRNILNDEHIELMNR